jgi:hypothetical protein
VLLLWGLHGSRARPLSPPVTTGCDHSIEG